MIIFWYFTLYLKFAILSIVIKGDFKYIDNYDKNEQYYEIAFSVLREKEKISITPIEELLGAYAEAAILFNRRWKFEHGKNETITDLEELVHDQAGDFIRMYIADKAQNEKFQALTDVPYPQLNISLTRLNELLDIKPNQNVDSQEQ